MLLVIVSMLWGIRQNQENSFGLSNKFVLEEKLLP